MFGSLLRSRPAKERVVGRDLSASPASPASQPLGRRNSNGSRRRATADFTEADDDDEDTHEDDTMPGFEAAEEDEDEDEDEDDDDDGDEVRRHPGRRTPLPVLPLFSASHLGMASPRKSEVRSS